uniref:Uncharacterized protein n=1 Tax=Acrobeloides nanus TaxID=290746 RepID=A0A914DWM9_9BILA
MSDYPLQRTRSSSVIRSGAIDLRPTSLRHRTYSMPDVYSYAQHNERTQTQWPFRYLYNDYWYDRYYYTGNVYYRNMFPKRYYYYFGSHVPVDSWNYPYHYWARAGTYSR